MQTKCPQCSQKLRVPDGMKNPLLRCPSCRNEFRLRSAQASISHGEVDFGTGAGLWRPSSPPSTVAAAPEILPDIPVTMPAIPPSLFPEREATSSPYPSFDTTVRPRKSPAFEGLKNLARGSLGTISLVAVLFLLKGGPRVARHFFREQPPPQPQPVQFEMDQNEALQRQIQEIRDRVHRERLRQQKAVDDLGDEAQEPPVP